MYKYNPTETPSTIIHMIQCSSIFRASIQVATILPAVINASPQGTSELVKLFRRIAVTSQSRIKMTARIKAVHRLILVTGSLSESEPDLLRDQLNQP